MGFLAMVVAMILDPVRLILCGIIGFFARSYAMAFGLGAIAGLVIVGILSSIQVLPIGAARILMHVVVSASLATGIYVVVKKIRSRKAANDA